MIDQTLVQKTPDRDDELRSLIDLLYSFKQTLIFLRYKHEFVKTDEERAKIASEMQFGRLVEAELLRHNAYLESTLINIRAIDEFFRQKSSNPKSAADVRFESIFKKAPPPTLLLERDDLNSINQLFAHITANRNTDRVPKQGFDLVKLIKNAVEKFNEILSESSKPPIKQELENCSPLPYVLEAICITLEEANELLAKESAFEQTSEHRQVQFNVSGSNYTYDIT